MFIGFIASTVVIIINGELRQKRLHFCFQPRLSRLPVEREIHASLLHASTWWERPGSLEAPVKRRQPFPALARNFPTAQKFVSRAMVSASRPPPLCCWPRLIVHYSKSPFSRLLIVLLLSSAIPVRLLALSLRLCLRSYSGIATGFSERSMTCATFYTLIRLSSPLSRKRSWARIRAFQKFLATPSSTKIATGEEEAEWPSSSTTPPLSPHSTSRPSTTLA